VPVIPALRRRRQEDHEFKVSMGYIGRTCLKKKNLKKKVTEFGMSDYICVWGGRGSEKKAQS
jgi:hypothetical protein